MVLANVISSSRSKYYFFPFFLLIALDKQFLYTFVPACSSQVQGEIFHANLSWFFTQDGATLDIQIPEIQEVNGGWLVLSPF